MSDKESKSSPTDLAKNIWLAGLGAYGKAFDEAQGRYEKVSKETTRLFDDLVDKGRSLETETSDIIHEAKERSSSSLDDRITKVRQSLGFGEFSKDAKLDELNTKVDELADKLDKIMDVLAAKPANKTAAKTEDEKPKATRTRSSAAKSTPAS